MGGLYILGPFFKLSIAKQRDLNGDRRRAIFPVVVYTTMWILVFPTTPFSLSHSLLVCSSSSVPFSLSLTIAQTPRRESTPKPALSVCFLEEGLNKLNVRTFKHMKTRIIFSLPLSMDENIDHNLFPYIIEERKKIFNWWFQDEIN